MEDLKGQASCIIQAVENAALTYPSQTALYEEKTGRSFTYTQLMILADKLSSVLKRKINYPKNIDIGDETPLVAFLTERSLVSIVCILAILKARAAYVPVDPSFPSDRQQHILEHSKCQIALVDAANQSRIKEIRQIVPVTILLNNETGEVDEFNENIYLQKENFQPSLPVLTDKSLAYVLYTSGSTGKPKGVMVKNRGLWNVVHYFVDLLQISCKDRVLGLTTLCFDISMLEIFMPLVSGACLVLITVQTQKNPMKLIQGITSADWGGFITIMQATPTTYEMLISCGWEGDPRIKFLVGGEACRPKVAALAPYCKAFYNVYGPTETSIWSSSYLLPTNPEAIDSLSSNISVGKPIWKTMFYVVDENGKDITNSGQEGELWIGGDGVALGYLHAPDLTTARFFKNPFGYGEVYRTGDVFRCLPDGNYLFVRRLDDQVKVNGYRIELGEVEIAISADERVEQAVVIVKDNVLIAFIHFFSDYRCSFKDNKSMHKELSQVAARKLPPYMIPKYFVEVDSFPTTANGKLDRLTMSKQINIDSLVAENSSNLIPEENHKREVEDKNCVLKKTKENSLSSMTEFVKAQVIKMTGDRNVSSKVGFAAFGIDSITAMMFRNMLSQSLGGCKVDANDLYDPDATIESFSIKLFTRLEQENPKLLKDLGIQFAKDPEEFQQIPLDIESGHSANMKTIEDSSSELDRLALRHRPLIEALRGIATILVVIDHYFWFPLVGGARIRVDTVLFIILTGFTTGLTDASQYLRYISKERHTNDELARDENSKKAERHCPYYLSSWNPRNFLYSKFIGLFPLYWMVLLFSIPIIVVYSDKFQYPAGESTAIVILYITGLQHWTPYTWVIHYVYYVSLLWNIFIMYALFKTILITKKEKLNYKRKVLIIVGLIVVLVIDSFIQPQQSPGSGCGYFLFGMLTAVLLNHFLQQRSIEKRRTKDSFLNRWPILNFLHSKTTENEEYTPVPLATQKVNNNSSGTSSSTSWKSWVSWYFPCFIADLTSCAFLMGIFFNSFDSIGQFHSSVRTPRLHHHYSSVAAYHSYHSPAYKAYDSFMLTFGLPLLFCGMLLSHFLLPIDRVNYSLSYLLIAKNKFLVLLGECALAIYIFQRLFFRYYYFWIVEGIVAGEFPFTYSFMKAHDPDPSVLPTGGIMRQHVWIFWIGVFTFLLMAIWLQKYFQDRFIMWLWTSPRSSSSSLRLGNCLQKLFCFGKKHELIPSEEEEEDAMSDGNKLDDEGRSLEIAGNNNDDDDDDETICLIRR